MARFAAGRGNGGGYPELHRWSVENPAAFWAAVADYAGLPLRSPPRTIVEAPDAMPGARWFPGATLNFAEALLGQPGEGPAIVFGNEREERESLDWIELEQAVAAVAAFLVSAGVTAGDRVAGILPNRPETIVAALASASIGAVWSSCSPDFGEAALLDRLGQIEPKVLFGTAAYWYGGKRIDCLERLRTVTRRIRSIAATIVVPYAEPEPDIAGLPGAAFYDDIAAAEARFEPVPLPFDHPLYVMFSSGTTGPPKCIVHGAGGTLLQHRKEHLLHTDLNAGDRLFYFTTAGWMMWNWLISALAGGVTLVLYDGSPFHPDPGVLWRLADDVGIDVFGTSARYLSALEQSGYRPRGAHDLARVRTILSTGSPLAPASFRFVAEHIDPAIQVASIAGGTDIVSCFMLGNPMLPVYPGEIQCLGLGMDVRIFDPDGAALRHGTGELVCARPFPSMPLGFLHDDDGSRYASAYFERFPGVWCHGDFAELTEHGGVVMHGRSDAVLNPGGVRIGTAEIYRVVEQLDDVLEAVAVGQQVGADSRVVLFVRLREGVELTAALAAGIRRALRTRLSPRHVPAVILAVDAVPHTINGKLSELAVRDVIHGRPVANLDALANPESLEQFRNRPELAT